MNWGDLRIVHTSRESLVLARGAMAALVSWGTVMACLVATAISWRVASKIGLAMSIVTVLAALVARIERRFIFDKAAGILTIEEQLPWTAKRTVIPLFHLRGVVVTRTPRATYIAMLQRRNGAHIFLDTAPQSHRLVRLAQHIADFTDLRYAVDIQQSAR